MDACDLESLIRRTYKVKKAQCDIVSGIMMDQKTITLDVCPQNAEDTLAKEAIEKFQAGELRLSDNYPNNAQTMGPLVLEFVIDNLCFKEKIEEGGLLLRFDD